MAEAETNQDLANRIQQTIRDVTGRIQGYVQSVNTFSGEYDTEVERLRGLIERLRQCLERLGELANGLTTINQRILLLGTRIENLQRRVATEVEAAGAGCRETLQNIEAQLEGLNELPGEFSIDIETLRTQVTDIEQLIESLCGDADDTISTMLRNRSAQINETLDRMQERDGGSSSGGETKSGSGSERSLRLPTPEGQGRRTMTGTLPPGDGNVLSRIAELEATQLAPTSPASEAERLSDARIRRGNPITSGPFPQPRETSNVSRERLGFGSTSTRGGWQTPEKLESLSRTRPVRTLAVLKKKKKKKTKKKKHRKRNKKTRGRNRRKKRSRKR